MKLLLATLLLLTTQDPPGAKPRKEKPVVVLLAIRPEKSEWKPGEVLKVAFDLEIPKTWHIYPAGKKPLLGKPTVFTFENAEVAGKIEEPPLTIKNEPGMGDFDFHEGKVTITVPLKMGGAGRTQLRGTVKYQISDPNVCVDNETPLSVSLAVAAQAAEGEKFDATLENIEKRTTRTVFENGMKLAALQKPTRPKTVGAHLVIRYGTEADFSGKDRVAVSVLGKVISSGTTKLSFQQLKDKWSELKANVNFSASLGILDVSIVTTNDNLPAVLALVDEVLRSPSCPQDQFDVMIQEKLKQLDDENAEPGVQAGNAAMRMVAQYPKMHPLYVPTTDESIRDVGALTLADFKKFPPMFGMSNATMTVIGDFDSAAIKGWAEKNWGTWKSPKPWNRIERKYFPTTGGQKILNFADKTHAMVMAFHSVEMKDDDADAPAIAVANYTLSGDGGHGGRLAKRLQGVKRYLAYSGMNLSPLDAAGVFVARTPLNPEDAKKGMAAMIDEIDKFVATGITADELAGAKKGVLERFQGFLSNNFVLHTMLQDDLYLGRTTAYWAERNKAIEALTLAQVNEVIKKRYKPGSLFKITAGDQKKM